MSEMKTSAEPLPGDSWEVRYTKTVVRAIAHYKAAAGMTTGELAAAVSLRAGDPGYLKPTTLNNLLAGKRRSIGVAELLLFAFALEVPPLALLVPVGIEDSVEMGPDWRIATVDAVDLVTRSLFVGDEPDLSDTPVGHVAVLLRALEEHHLAAEALHHQLLRLGLHLQSANQPEGLIDAELRGVQGAWGKLRAIRFDLIARGTTPPSLDPISAWVDSLEAESVDRAAALAITEPIIKKYGAPGGEA
ncbi:hypothetical protein [Curtobacterium sp. MCLR17_043]|uniref:hypothetical protein n=1 Tax=Curtobacterium sp. MCLR17_043 TaxID=2175627 RepID=UPI0015E899D0|nr:hypothetical protein [Curtobacterium sp. MCLR17_043]